MKTEVYQQQLYDACKEHSSLAQQALDRYVAAKTDQERECAKIDNLKHLAACHALQWALDKTIDIKQEIKQAKIDVLNTARERCDLVAEELEDEIDHYGSSAAYSCAYEIKKLIKEIEEQ